MIRRHQARNHQIEMNNLVHVLDGYDLYFILIFAV